MQPSQYIIKQCLVAERETSVASHLEGDWARYACHLLVAWCTTGTLHAKEDDFLSAMGARIVGLGQMIEQEWF